MRISAGVQTCALPIYDEVDVEHRAVGEADALHPGAALDAHDADPEAHVDAVVAVEVGDDRAHGRAEPALEGHRQGLDEADLDAEAPACGRSEEHTSELQSLMRISYAVFCLKKKKKHN